MLKLTFAQLHQPVLSNLDLLTKDVTMHLQEYRPELFRIYPAGYLRWDIAPGFYRQPQIAAVLQQTSLPGMRRFEVLATEGYADAWLEAVDLDDEQEWRARFWQ